MNIEKFINRDVQSERAFERECDSDRLDDSPKMRYEDWALERGDEWLAEGLNVARVYGRWPYYNGGGWALYSVDRECKSGSVPESAELRWITKGERMWVFESITDALRYLGKTSIAMKVQEQIQGQKDPI